MTQANSRSSLYTTLVFLSLLLTLVTVILSAYIRLSTNGIGCADWPDCFGQVGVLSQYDAMTSFSNALPDKPHGVARALHRVVASILGVLVVLIVVSALRMRKQGGPGLLLPLAVLGLTLFLAILGYSTPSPWIPAVTLGNLLGGMLMLALLWWMGQQSVAEPLAPPAPRELALKPWAAGGAVLLVLQISLGAWTSANYAGPACPGLGPCEGSWLPVAGLAGGFDLMRTLAVDAAGRIVMDQTMPAIHMVHRWGALLTFVYLAGLALYLLRAGRVLRTTAIAILVLLVLQIGLGVTQILAGLPLLVVTAHNAVAAFLLLAVVNLNQRLYRSEP